MEHAAREMEDAGLYNDLKVSDTRQLETDPGFLARFQPPFDQCFQAAPGSELRTRVETLWREMNIQQKRAAQKDGPDICAMHG